MAIIDEQVRRPETILERLNRLEGLGDERHSAIQELFDGLIRRVGTLEEMVGVTPDVRAR